jgi:CubicO group peptidase (beta-lactamase class C family)
VEGFMKNIGIAFCFVTFILAGCKGSSTPTQSSPTTTDTSTCAAIETRLSSLLDTVEATDNLPYTYLIERLSDGKQFSYSKAGSTVDTTYESASTSKMISAAIILRAVENGDLSLTTRPQDKITTTPIWPIINSDSLYPMTLTNLLSFTSGLITEPFCINSGIGNFNNCTNTIATTNSGGVLVPGNEFYYSGTHLQVAGRMVISAKLMSTWQDVFSEFKTQTGLFPTSTYDLPSSTNPRLAGGMHWTANEYIAFLRKLAKGQLLNSSMMTTYLQDRTASATMTYSPIKSSSLNEEWHYGFGYWHECQSANWNCTAATRISSPGAYGAYPFWDITNGYIGIVARQSPTTGTFPYGIAIERAVRSLSQEWISCNP